MNGSNLRGQRRIKQYYLDSQTWVGVRGVLELETPDDAVTSSSRSFLITKERKGEWEGLATAEEKARKHHSSHWELTLQYLHLSIDHINPEIDYCTHLKDREASVRGIGVTLPTWPPFN